MRSKQFRLCGRFPGSSRDALPIRLGYSRIRPGGHRRVCGATCGGGVPCWPLYVNTSESQRRIFSTRALLRRCSAPALHGGNLKDLTVLAPAVGSPGGGVEQVDVVAAGRIRERRGEKVGQVPGVQHDLNREPIAALCCHKRGSKPITNPRRHACWGSAEPRRVSTPTPSDPLGAVSGSPWVRRPSWSAGQPLSELLSAGWSW